MVNTKILFKLLPVLVILSLFFMVSCSANTAEFHETRLLFGTVVTLQAYGKNAKEGIRTAFDAGAEIERLMSAQLEDSELSKVNQQGLIAPVTVSPQTFFVASKALEYAKLSKGGFDPAIGKLVKLWGIGTDNARVPDAKELAPYINQALYQKVILDSSSNTIRLLDESCSLDFGGIAKGYAADEIKRILKENYGITSGILNLGGNVLAIGNKPDGKPWNVGIKDPYHPETSEIVGKVAVTDQSVVTSGTYERFFEQDSKIYHHIFDPRTGFPSDNSIMSVTIISNSSLAGDALSTSVFVMGKEKGLNLIETLPDIEAIVITKDKKIYTSSGIDETSFVLLDKEDYTYEKR